MAYQSSVTARHLYSPPTAPGLQVIGCSGSSHRHGVMRPKMWTHLPKPRAGTSADSTISITEPVPPDQNKTFVASPPPPLKQKLALYL